MQNKLPQGWVECQLGEVFDIRDGTHDSPKYHDIGYPLVTSKNLKNGLIDLEKVSLISEKDYNKINERSKVSIGDILFAMIGTIGNPVIIVDEPQFAIKNVALFKYNNLINNKYLKYFLESPKTLNMMHSQAKGSTQKFVGLGYLRTFIFPVCPLNEQRRIVEKIESEFAKIDEGLEHLEQAKEQIKQYRQSVLKSAFSINNKNEKCLDEITNKINDGTHKTPTYIEKGIPFISVKDIRNKKIFFDNCKFISEDEHQILFKRCNPEYGDVLITKSGTIGRTAIVNTNKNFDLFVSVALLKPKKDLITSEFLMYALDNYIASIDVKQEVKGGVIKNLHIEDLKKITICLPPLGEQKKIVEEIEKRFAVADEVEKVVEQNIEKAKQLKQSILKKAFEGRLVPQDPTDEPASTLIEKIKQERNKKC